MFEWDEAKRKQNLAKHGIDFETVWDIDWENAMQLVDTRNNYDEIRYIALGYCDGRLVFCVYTSRGKNKRIISLRKANKKEIIFYEEEAINR